MNAISNLVVTTDLEFGAACKDFLESNGEQGLIATPASLDFKDGHWLHVLHSLVTEVAKPEEIKHVYVLIEEPHSEFVALPSSVFNSLWRVFKDQDTTVTVVNNAMHHYGLVGHKTKAARLTHDSVFNALKVKHTARLILLEHFGLSAPENRKSGEQSYEGLLARARFVQALNAPFLTTAIYGT